MPLVDDGIAWTTRDGYREVIWGDMDRDEIGSLVKRIVRSGMISPAAAQAVRGMVRIWDEYQWLIVTGPRFRRTFTHYLRHGFGFSVPSEPPFQATYQAPREAAGVGAASMQTWSPPV